MRGDRTREAVEAARALMLAEGITAAAAGRRLAPRFGMSPETIRRATVGVVYAKSTQGNLHVRVERVELIVAELQRRLDEIETPGFKPKTGAHRATRLTEAQVREIRRIRKVSDATMDDLAARFDVSTATISRIVNMQAWTHVI